MKDYNEMAESVLERRDKYNAKKRMVIHTLKKGMTGLSCCLVAVLGLYMMRGNQLTSSAPVTSNYPVQTDTIKLPTEFSSDQDSQQESQLWMSADEILKIDNGAHMGVFVPSFLSWRGGFYCGAESTSTDRFAPTDNEIWFNPEYRYRVYYLKDFPNKIAIYINGKLQVYQKAFDVTFDVDGVTYGIQYSPNMDTDYIAGNTVMSVEGFTVYEAIRIQGEAESREYLVNILPLLKEQWPDLFSDDQNYSNEWQVALPLDKI